MSRSIKTRELTEHNQILKDLSVRLTCGFIDIGPKITYQGGSIDASKYTDSIHLNSNGTQILIDAFVVVIPDLKLTKTGNQWTEVVKVAARTRMMLPIIIIMMIRTQIGLSEKVLQTVKNLGRRTPHRQNTPERQQSR